MNIMNRIARKVARALGIAGRREGSLRAKFSKIYEENLFGGKLSRSGEGSNMVQTEEVRKWLPDLVRRLDVHRFLDAPCGDLFWMQHLDFGDTKYIGVDIVEELIERNTRAFAAMDREFYCANLAVDELPRADMIFCRDCLVHLSFEDALSVLRQFKNTGAEYLVTTTFSERDENLDLYDEDGRDRIWRTLNLVLPPFNFPEPIELFNENCSEGGGLYGDKCVGVWRLQELPLVPPKL